ncbi:glycosyl transferase [Halobacteroides halobius DSM 5150]|uniref:Glycosyl transferase n=1 Tax=Halobacteroides halobius (strain ATCC 35273 / DSM 5150 / MD-1) TaxID=748449 RepID=L0KAT3_HALHC|nr:glycosyltransferase [Halobacteroides halobius]AGB42126.1 glycosyl transferase [Halobacteroides halobius DSM 5150]
MYYSKERKITAIIPTYNSEKFIEETIYSILNQTKPLNEIIVVDDNSKDNTINIIKKFIRNYSQIKLHKLKCNQGSSQVRNIGMKIANNDWVLFMDHDDIAEPELLEKECQRLIELNNQNEEEFVLVHSAYQQIDEKGDLFANIHSWKQAEPKEILGYQFVRNRIISNSGVLLNKKLALEIGGYDLDLHYSQDWDLWLRLCQLGGFGYVDEPLVKLRRHSQNTSRKVEDFLNDEQVILNKYSINFIEEAINKRNLSDEINKIDFVSVLFRLNQLERAYQVIQEVINMAPNLTSGYFFLGLYFLKRSNLNQARQAFEKAIKLASENAAAINNLGCIMLLQNENKKAKILFEKSINILPNYIDANHNLEISIENKKINREELKFTWRELRSTLLNYSK